MSEPLFTNGSHRCCYLCLRRRSRFRIPILILLRLHIFSYPTVVIRGNFLLSPVQTELNCSSVVMNPSMIIMNISRNIISSSDAISRTMTLRSISRSTSVMMVCITISIIIIFIIITLMSIGISNYAMMLQYFKRHKAEEMPQFLQPSLY